MRRFLGGISQERFSRMLGVTLRTAARWEASATLPPQALAQIYSLAVEVQATDLAEFFKSRIQAGLGLLGSVDSLIQGVSYKTPGTPDEQQLVDTFLSLYRAADPEIQPFVDQLRKARSDQDTAGARWSGIRRRGRPPKPAESNLGLLASSGQKAAVPAVGLLGPTGKKREEKKK
ncbi:MAG TPA: hypothetical protein VKB79_09505 [Bryobacteraceae bacterium]|nr:hypothetical protein [Bryobacteraceae bacterium]